MRRLVLLARTPRLGRVKTRLVPPLRPEESLRLYRAFLDDQLRWLRTLQQHCGVEVCFDAPSVPESPDGVDVAELRQTEQGPGDLGERLLRAFRRARDEGAATAIAVGSDSPTLPTELVLNGFASLERGAEAIVAPAEDGGYVLLGMRTPHPELFDRVPWGTSRVLAVTIERARAGGIDLVRLPGWYDVDDRVGLSRLQHDLAGAEAAARAPSTARALATLAYRGS